MARFSKFMLGGLFGAAVGMLFAPKSGRELRQSLMGGNPPALPPTEPESPVEAHDIEAQATAVMEPEPAVYLEERVEESRREVEAELSKTVPDVAEVEAEIAAEAAVEEAAEEEAEDEAEAGPEEAAAEEAEDEAEAGEPDTEPAVEVDEKLVALDAGDSEEVSPIDQSDAIRPAVDRDVMRQRIEETRSRLKAKAFDSMVEGETLIATGDEGVSMGDNGGDPGLDDETDEMIDQLLEEED